MPTAWHALLPPAALEATGTPAGGLEPVQAEARLREVGPNELPQPRPPTLLAVIVHQFTSPLIYILLFAAGAALALGDATDAGFILAVVLINAGLGTWQEWKAEQSAAALKHLLRTTARVIRGGETLRIPAEQVVPGDLVLLESGDRIPADLRLLQAKGLSVDEALLTGESLPVNKEIAPLPEDTPVSDRRNMAFAGAVVMAGRARGVVVATGRATEVGAIAQEATSADAAKPPLVIRMERFARQVSLAVVGAAAVLAFIAAGRGMPMIDVLFLAVALAVSAIPEGLPVAMTVALSVATTRMARRKVIIRRLTAVEGLGSCTCIASDKTGTLTLNRQTVRRLTLPDGTPLRVTGEGHVGEGEVTAEDGSAPADAVRDRVARLARAAALCNEAVLEKEAGGWRHHGDAVDVALLAFAIKAGLDLDAVRGEVRSVGEIPFESERSYAALFYQDGDRTRVAVKGALEVLLPRCDRQLGPSGPTSLDTGAIERAAEALSATGHRFIAVAEGAVSLGPPTRDEYGEGDLPPLTLLGLVGFIDPPRPEVAQAVAECRKAGIMVAMVTGDHPVTALAIAREIGIADADDQVVTGRELAALGESSEAAFLEKVRGARVFARVTPLQKLHVVDALLRLGHFVAVTGDGVNDAPALRKANIGVAMGSGTDVAKDAAEIIVADDNFASIEAGVEEGRFAYDNLRKVTYLLISTGAAEVALFTLALVAGMPLPLLAVQILWLNLVTNGIQHVALAFEGGEPGAMHRRPRRPTEGIFDRLMIQQTLVAGLVMAVLVFINWVVLLEVGFTETEARNRLLLLFVLLQNFHVFNCRSERVSAFRVPLARNRVVVWGVLGALGIHVLAMHQPLMQRVLRLEPILIQEWVVPVLIASLVLVTMETFKWWRARRAGE